MLTLSLLRHAKSSWDDLTLDDYERGLAPRGIKAAPLIGRYIAKEKLKPDLVLCSAAVRTRATLTLLLAELPPPPPDIRYEDALYLASPAAILRAVQEVDSPPAHIMVIGHNPGMHALALELTGSGERDDIQRLATRYPTATLAVLTFRDSSWKDVRPATGRLEHLVMPKGLKD